MKNYYVASVSFGKDSLAMLLLLLEKQLPLDEVVFVNTGYEFNSTYAMRDRFLVMLKERNKSGSYPWITYTEIDISEEFTYAMFEKPVFHKGQEQNPDAQCHRVGFGWCGGVCRWGTGLKFDGLRKFYREILRDKKRFPDGVQIIEYVGIAADEKDRLERETAICKGCQKSYPLVDYNLKEKDCLEMCYENGYTYQETVVDKLGASQKVFLYRDLVSRGSCRMCRNKNLKELSNLYHLGYQTYFKPLLDMQEKIPEPFYQGRETVSDLVKRFDRRGYQLSIDQLFDFV